MILDIQLRLHDTLRDFVRILEITNEEVSEVVELGGQIGVLGQSRMYHRVLWMLKMTESRKVNRLHQRVLTMASS